MDECVDDRKLDRKENVGKDIVCWALGCPSVGVSVVCFALDSVW